MSVLGGVLLLAGAVLILHKVCACSPPLAGHRSKYTICSTIQDVNACAFRYK